MCVSVMQTFACFANLWVCEAFALAFMGFALAALEKSPESEAVQLLKGAFKIRDRERLDIREVQDFFVRDVITVAMCIMWASQCSVRATPAAAAAAALALQETMFRDGLMGRPTQLDDVLVDEVRTMLLGKKSSAELQSCVNLRVWLRPQTYWHLQIMTHGCLRIHS